MDPIETAWAAGLFEGEGSISVGHRPSGEGRLRVELSLGMTDRDVVDRFHSWAMTGAIHARYYEGRKTMYYWTVAGHKTRPLLEALLPFFGSRRKTKAHEALDRLLEIGTANADKTHCPQGHPYDQANTYITKTDSRLCKRCNRERHYRTKEISK